MVQWTAECYLSWRWLDQGAVDDGYDDGSRHDDDDDDDDDDEHDGGGGGGGQRGGAGGRPPRQPADDDSGDGSDDDDDEEGRRHDAMARTSHGDSPQTAYVLFVSPHQTVYLYPLTMLPLPSSPLFTHTQPPPAPVLPVLRR